MMKLVIFGTGTFLENRFDQFDKSDEIVAFLDNDESKAEKKFHSATIISPRNVSCCVDRCDKIILMAEAAPEMKKQLVGLGVDEEKIWFWGEYKKNKCPGIKKYVGKLIESPNCKGRIQIITPALNYNGGAMASIYAAEAMISRGYYVDIATPDCSEELEKELSEKHLHITIRPGLPYIDYTGNEWIEKYDLVVVNTLLMVRCASILSRSKRTIWWLHESISFYPPALGEFRDFFSEDNLKEIKVCAVSEVAKANFESQTSRKVDMVLPYGIPDKNLQDSQNTTSSKNIVFAIIASLCEGKAQDIFIEAARKIKAPNAEFWIIGGGHGAQKYIQKLQVLSEGYPQISFLGEMSRNRMEELFREIDVVVIPSRMDCLPICATEAMMYKIPYITSNVTGTAKFTEDGVNGLICNVEDIDDLADKMNWMINHPIERRIMGIEGRKNYEKNFSMKSFADNLEKIYG